ncbi:unnamed protein product [Meganyctiphanes norvegica]|uniref:Peptidase S1 domain-containing protein n=1 Tax=Meganyctiphanes norvegica TaxID=48144 RepID=A0AAV2QQJ8_MEGNR
MKGLVILAAVVTVTSAQGNAGSRNPIFHIECGDSFGDRVTIGTEVPVGRYPWLAVIGRIDPFEEGFFNAECGGTLITNRHVLSAAHCFAKTFKPNLVRLGEHNVTSNDDGAQDFTISRIILDEYSFTTKQNDVALITLDRDVTFNPRIQPICLPFRSDLRHNKFVGNLMTVAGWGRTEDPDSRGSDVPLEAQVQVVTLDRCQEAYGSITLPSPIVESQLCAGTGGADTCGGDSGGPLHYLDLQEERYYLAGITSFGKTGKCGSAEFPGVYSRVGSYLEWLEFNIL